MADHLMPYDPGIGATGEYSLRLSVATLVRLIYVKPGESGRMLALERKATLHRTESGTEIGVKAQPFGGAIQIYDLSRFRELIGGFRFDSERSRSEQDLRIYIKPTDWENIRDTCLQLLNDPHNSILENDPTRELTEELADSLKILVRPEQYVCKPISTITEDRPRPTANIHAQGRLTARICRVFEVAITDSSLAGRLEINSRRFSNQGLVALALADFNAGGKGRANAVLALPLEDVRRAYLNLTPEQRDTPLILAGNYLDVTVAAILDGVEVPRYRRMVA
jgi:hypothetical protein